jgi:hypothetical protein
MKKETILLITALILSATTAWASGINTFTIAGIVEGYYCPRDSAEVAKTESYRPQPSCHLELADEATGGRFRTSVSCGDPSVVEACRWLKPGDRALILGDETPFGKQATHVALLLHDLGDSRAAEGKSLFDGGGRFQLDLGQTIQVGSLRIRFQGVIEDSRCPEDVTCVWQGRVTVAIEVWEEVGAWSDRFSVETYQLTLGVDPAAERLAAGHLIRLESVLPVPRTDRKLDPADYVITLRVTDDPNDGCIGVWCPPVE